MQKVRVTRPWLRKFPWLTRFVLFVLLPITPVIIAGMVLKDHWEEIVDATVECFSATFLKWED